MAARNDPELRGLADDPVLQDLRKAYESDQLVLFVGPELSVAAGLPDWRRLTEQLMQRLRSRGGNASDIDGVQDLAQKQKHIEALSDLKHFLGAPEFCNAVEQALDDRDRELPEVALAIAAMKSRLRAVVTTNLDRLLERAFGGEWDVLARATADIASRRKYIFKIHGTLRERDTWVFTREQYDRAMFASPALQAAVKALFHSCPILFVGFDLDDDHFEQHLSEVRALSGEQPPAHFALLPERSMKPFRRRKLEAAGLRLMLYDDRDAEHAPVPAILRAIAASPSEPAAPSLPRLDRFIGRDALADELMHALVQDSSPRICLLGPAGIGKSTLSIAVLHRPEVVQRYGARRWFVRLDAATTAEAAVGLMATAMGLPLAGGDLRARVLAALGRERAVYVLDNLETPWEGDPDGTEALLGDIAAVEGVALVASVRSTKRPGGVQWSQSMRVDPLEKDAARALFCAIAPEHRDDPALDSLLAPLAGIPLAIALLAHAADGNSLTNLANEWQARRTAMLEREGLQPNRLSSWAVSLELSIGSRRMTGDAKRLGTLLATLPDGIAASDLEALLQGAGPYAARKLTEVGLSFFEGDRLKMLAPIREYVAHKYPPGADDSARAVDWYGGLALSLGDKAGRKGGAEAIARLAPETANLDAMLRKGLAGQDVGRWIDAAIALTKFACLSGRVTPSPLESAREAAHTARDTAREAKCIERLGDIALHRSEYQTARQQYEAALRLYRQVGSVLGEANCIQRLGVIALARSEHQTARQQYEAALPLYRQVGGVLSEANCIHNLGDIARQRSEYQTARQQYEAALTLYRQVSSVLGEANCIQGLGDIARQRSEYQTARQQYEAALPLYRQVGSVLGEANCIQRLGDIALAHSEHQTARQQYEAALALYRQVGSTLSEAYCIQSLGDIALQRSDPAEARACFDEALTLSARIPDPYLLGMTTRRLARLSVDSERRRHIEAARTAWTQIDRPDLVAQLDREFGQD